MLQVRPSGGPAPWWGPERSAPATPLPTVSVCVSPSSGSYQLLRVSYASCSISFLRLTEVSLARLLSISGCSVPIPSSLAVVRCDRFGSTVIGRL